MDKDIYNTNFTKLTYGRGYVYSLLYHIVWCVKYRRSVLTGKVENDLKKYLYEIADEYGFKIIKGNTARKLFLSHPELKAKLWGGHLWNPSYCIVTVSDRSYEMVKDYIESQKEKQ